MSQITTFNLINLKDEILNKLRVALNSYDSKSRITEVTTSFSGNGINNKFLLSATAMSYVKSVTVNGTPLVFVTDYDITWRGTDMGKVVTILPPIAGSNNVVIVWGQIVNATAKNFIYPDFPRDDIGIYSMPRIGFALTNREEAGGMGGSAANVLQHEMLLQIKIIDVDTYNIDYLQGIIRNYIAQNCKNFYYFPYIEPRSIGAYDNFGDDTAESHYKISEFVIPKKFEIITYA